MIPKIILIDLIDTIVSLPYKPASKYLNLLPSHFKKMGKNKIDHLYINDIKNWEFTFQILQDVLTEREKMDVRCIWENSYSRARINSDCLSFIETCMARGLKVIIASNSIPTVRLLLEYTGLVSKVSDVYLSCSIGKTKPSKDFFKHIIRDVPSYDCWMIGNSIEKDVRPAAELGIKSFWYRPGSSDLTKSEKEWMAPNADKFVEFGNYNQLIKLLNTYEREAKYECAS